MRELQDRIKTLQEQISLTDTYMGRLAQKNSLKKERLAKLETKLRGQEARTPEVTTPNA